jgi:very-short-patch-repair endonuclease
MLLPEVLLLTALRKRPAGLRFRRQHPAGPYILDFFCPECRLGVEVDGEVHSRGDRPEKDRVRDSWIQAQGVRTLRILASDILADLDAVVRHVVVVARGEYPSTACGGPPPPPGED